MTKRRVRRGRVRHMLDATRAFVRGDGAAGERRGSTIAGMLAIVVMMVFGGGIPALLATVSIAIVGLLLLSVLMASGGWSALRSQSLAFRVGLIGIALLPLLQVTPLPPSLWHALPGQGLRIQTLALAGLADSWQPLSVTPLYTAGAAVIAIAFVALVALLLSLPPAGVRRIAWLIFGLIGLNILIGLVQVASGGQALQVYKAADHGALLGFYANKNHAALVLATAMPIAAYLFGSRAQVRGTGVWLALCAGIVLIAIVTTNSRAGIGLGFVTLLLLGSLYVRSVKPVYLLGGIAIATAIAVLVSTTSAFEQVFSRFNLVDEDLRWQFLWTSRPIIERYWLLGSGIGSFSTLYAVNEALAWVKPTYVNQLHDEYPQLLLETGLPGVALLVALVAGLGMRAWQFWRHGNRTHRLPLLCGALILVLIAIHSAVDYPLRRPAVLPILALALVLVIREDLTASTGIVRRKQRS